jgi:hypothetical protein
LDSSSRAGLRSPACSIPRLRRGPCLR